MQSNQSYYTEKNRNSAYLDIIETLPQRQAMVYRCVLEFGPITTERIAELLNVYPNYITGRVKELRDRDLIELCGFEKSEKSNKQASLWKIKQLEPQMAFKF